MAGVPVLIVEADAGRAAGHADALGRLGYASVIRSDWRAVTELEPALVLIGPADIGSLGDLRRVARDTPVLLVCDDATADEAARALDADNVSFVAANDDADYAIALMSLRHGPFAAFSDGDGGYALRLAALGEEIARIARSIEPPAIAARAPPVPDAPMTFDPAVLRATLKARRLRDSLFALGTFSDPTWDMLLDLAASRADGRPVSVTSLAIAAAVPPSTALRHLKAMAEAGMVVRRPDPHDGRRIFIELSEDAFSRMRAWVAGSAKGV